MGRSRRRAGALVGDVGGAARAADLAGRSGAVRAAGRDDGATGERAQRRALADLRRRRAAPAARGAGTWSGRSRGSAPTSPSCPISDPSPSTRARRAPGRSAVPLRLRRARRRLRVPRSRPRRATTRRTSSSSRASASRWWRSARCAARPGAARKRGRWIALRELAVARPIAFHGEDLDGKLDVAWVLPERAGVYASAEVVKPQRKQRCTARRYGSSRRSRRHARA